VLLEATAIPKKPSAIFWNQSDGLILLKKNLIKVKHNLDKNTFNQNL